MSFFGKNLRKDISSDEKDVEMLIKLLVNVLPLFPNSDTFQRDIYNGSNENHYTEILIKFQQSTNEFDAFKYFTFMSQPQQNGKRTVDIGIYLTADNELSLIHI